MTKLPVGLSDAEQETLASLLSKMLASIGQTDIERCTLCRMCDDRVCTSCPISVDKTPQQPVIVR